MIVITTTAIIFLLETIRANYRMLLQEFKRKQLIKIEVLYE